MIAFLKFIEAWFSQLGGANVSISWKRVLEVVDLSSGFFWSVCTFHIACTTPLLMLETPLHGLDGRAGRAGCACSGFCRPKGPEILLISDPIDNLPSWLTIDSARLIPGSLPTDSLACEMFHAEAVASSVFRATSGS